MACNWATEPPQSHVYEMSQMSRPSTDDNGQKKSVGGQAERLSEGEGGYLWEMRHPGWKVKMSQVLNY